MHRWHALRRCMDGTSRARSAAARFPQFHARRDTGACRPTNCSKMSIKTVRRRRMLRQRLRQLGDCGRPCAGALMSRLAPGRQRHASHSFMLAATLGLVGRIVAIVQTVHHGIRIIGSGASSRPVMAARLARVHVWHVSPHGCSGTLSTVSC